MVLGIRRFLRNHTPAGQYINAVQHGTAIQREKLHRLDDAESNRKFKRYVEINSISPKIEKLIMGRGV